MKNINTLNISFCITDEVNTLINNIDKNLLLVSPVDDENIKINSRARAIHSSLAIENNSLSLIDVERVLYDRVVFGDSKEIQDVKDINELYERIDEFNWNSEESFISAYVIMMKYFDDGNFYRDHGEGIVRDGKIIYVAPNSLVVSSLMRSLFKFLDDNKDSIHPLILSAIFHYYLVYIHPFSDGNGRIARFWVHLILNNWNSKFKYIPIEEEIYLNQDRYYEVINECHNNGNANKFIEFMLKIINSVLEKTTQKTTQKINLNANQIKIVEYIKSNPSVTRWELANMLNISSDGVKYNLKKLKEKKVIERIGPDKGGYWIVK